MKNNQFVLKTTKKKQKNETIVLENGFLKFSFKKRSFSKTIVGVIKQTEIDYYFIVLDTLQYIWF